MPDSTSSSKQLLSVRLSPKSVKKIKLEKLERGKGTTEATIIQEALNIYWRLTDKKITLSKLPDQFLAKVPINQMDFGMDLLLEEKLCVLDTVMRAHFEHVNSKK